jgi:hypothetical protein
MGIILTGLSRDTSPNNTHGKRWNPLQSHSDCGPKNPDPSRRHSCIFASRFQMTTMGLPQDAGDSPIHSRSPRPFESVGVGGYFVKSPNSCASQEFASQGRATTTRSDTNTRRHG